MTIDFVTVAATALAGTKLKIVGAEAFVPNTAGLYAIYGDAATWHQLGLGEPPDARSSLFFCVNA